MTLRPELPLRDTTLAQIGTQPHITMGVCEGNRLALVVDTLTREDDQSIWQWLNALPGVSLVEVAFVGFEEQEQTR